MEIILTILLVVFLFFAVTFTIYWFNLDMKLVNKLYFGLKKHYDNRKRDRRL